MNSLEQVRKDVERIKSTPPGPMKASSDAANKFVSGLDAVTDALLLVIMKFGRATTALWSVGIVVVVCLIVMLAILVDLYSLSTRMSYIEIKQQEIPALCSSATKPSERP